ncbi:cardiolipin synthase [Rhodoligotrophos appendicifer]|uniref:CDP-diacylglycerol--glycerol-3-phosphate 3-phosphatidyltransferase n=1 Tax=Rhodoligotrophos appendicifer TaxID=987056 RepID=UPI001185FC0D|nr:CDP-diacylglycerol--glycerol-3-phosphate 3-phosphatidyltransferase [Rhodoligotrophos appendicifer]
MSIKPDLVRQRRARIFNLPNILTFGRIAAVPLLVACFFLDGDRARWIAVAIFLAAAISDFFDGYLARLWSQQSSLGRMLDPIADKLLVAAVLLMLTGERTIDGIHVIAAVIILLREVLVSGLREYLAELRVSVPVTQLSKWKTTLQMVAIGFLLAGEAGDRFFLATTTIGLIGLWVAALLTLYTGYDYLKAGVERVVEEDQS